MNGAVLTRWLWIERTSGPFLQGIGQKCLAVGAEVHSCPESLVQLRRNVSQCLVPLMLAMAVDLGELDQYRDVLELFVVDVVHVPTVAYSFAVGV
jgi:hypothetical protein